MQEFFPGRRTVIEGSRIPSARERDALQDAHRRRLEALDRLSEAAAECGVAADPDRDIFTLPEDDLILLEQCGPPWAGLGGAIRDWRSLVPLCRLGDFGFPEDADNPLEEANSRLRRIGGGVEAWAFAAEDGSVYKFYWPHEEKRIGSTFDFRHGEEVQILAEARSGSYRELLEKLQLIEALGGMSTEIVGVTAKEGILVAKQTLGEPLAQGDDMSERLPAGLIEIPSRFLRANRDHPRLFFLEGRPYLVADLHARNFVRAVDGELRLIDLVGSPWPEQHAADGLIGEWVRKKRADPGATALPGARDEEL